MAKPNYSFEKRQRERAKKQKKEEKLQARRSGAVKSGEVPPANPSEVEAPVPGAPAPPPSTDTMA
ncbi:MAG: hypothetical protein OEM00_05620 [Burkholderiaceae bacterium]|nr:hypothetical protein [Burkholderiaceae bacterium]